MINVDQCRGCGRTLVIHRLPGVDVRLEPEALDAQEAITTLLAGRPLWRMTPTSITSAKPDALEALSRYGNTEGPHVAREHVCTARGGAYTPPPAREATPAPKEPERAPAGLSPTTPSDRQQKDSGARRAGTPASDLRCSACGNPMGNPETDVIFQLGATVVDAFHTECA